jgi:iron complex outermembrane receptor protein
MSVSFLLFLSFPLLQASEDYSFSREELDNLQTSGYITGKVTDEAGYDVPGVSVFYKGLTGGTVTASDGSYQIERRNDGLNLIFSFIGMETKEVEVQNQQVIDVVLVEAITRLTEIVAVGYGSQKKSDITGAVTSVKRDDFNQGISSTPGQLLQGKVSGLNVTSSSGAPGSDQRIIIRGQGSIRQGTGPLFVIDGFPVGLAGTGADSNPLNFLNSEDIESIDVLKDASATAIYGSRGANGVVLITTRKGKAGDSSVSVSSSFGVSTISKKIPVFSADEFRTRVIEIGGKLEDRGGNTDWQDELTQQAWTSDHNLTLTGGSENFTYRASAGYLNQEGIVIHTGLERYSARVGATQKLIDGRLNIDFNLSSSVEKGENSRSGTLVSEMLDFNPTYEARDENGDPINYPDLTNPLISAELYKNYEEKRRMMFSISPSLEIVNGLVYKVNFGYENRSTDVDDQSIPSTSPFEEGRLQQDYSNGTNLLIENYLTYNYRQAGHDATLLAGHSYQETFDRWRRWSINQFPENGVDPRYNPGMGQRIDLVDNKPQGWALINELQSFFGRMNYSYNGKYMATATIRMDGSSKFGDNNKYGVFPSFAGGWRISEEGFMTDGPVSNLKLRAGWGQTGNQEIPAKITQALYTTQVSGGHSYPLDNSGEYPAGTTFVRLANPDIQWEVSTQTNVGLDFGFLNGALSGTVDYFHKVSDNILLEVVPSDPIQPTTTYWTNVPDMTITNTGWELALDYQRRRAEGFSYGIGGNLSLLDNVVEGSPYTVLATGSASGSGLTGATINGIINGHPVGSFYMQKFLGIGEDGLSQFEESEDGGRMVVGSALPDLLYSFYLNARFKGFDLALNFNGVSGNKIYNNTAMNKFYKALLANSRNTTDKALEYSNESIANSSSVSTRYLEDGSFLRLNNATLGYNFNTSKVDWIQGLRLSVTGQNLFVITDYSGFDPEVNQDRSVGGIQSHGIDLNGYPKARTFVFSLNASF